MSLLTFLVEGDDSLGQSLADSCEDTTGRKPNKGYLPALMSLRDALKHRLPARATGKSCVVCALIWHAPYNWDT